MAANSSRRVFKVNRDRHMIVTPIVRLSFPQLFTPRSYQDDPDSKKVYRCDLLFTKEQLQEPYNGKKAQTVSLLTAIRYAKEDMWGTDKKRWPRFNHPVLKDGNTKVNQDNELIEAYENMWYVTAKTGENYPPILRGPRGEKNLTEQDIYGGCWVRAQILVKAYDSGNKGIALYLNEIMKVRDDEKFGGFPTIEMDDEEVDDETSDIDSNFDPEDEFPDIAF